MSAAEKEQGRLRGMVTLAVVVAAASVSIPFLFAVAVLARVQTSFRRLRRASPRVVMGPTALISIKYWSHALRQRGYRCLTRVPHPAGVNTAADYDVVKDTLLGSVRLYVLFGYPLSMAWAMLRGDVLVCFLDGSFLRWTQYWRLEGPLLRAAGKKLVVSPYGSDVAVPGHLGPLEKSMLEEYPVFLELGDRIRERVDYYCRWADVVIGNWQVPRAPGPGPDAPQRGLGYMPRSDLLWPTMLAIDTDQWPEVPPGDGDGRDGPVTVVHAPNHRLVKGTDALIEAVAELRSEGIDVELDLLERRPNEEVREAILRADIVADQFISGYAMFAIEGMSAGKPVLSAMGWLPDSYLEALGECPIVGADLASVTDVLRGLVTDPAERRRVGRASREFALAKHSLEAAGEGWELIVAALWTGGPMPRLIQPAPTPPRSGTRS